jgi:putative addiction module component (TIGR02574 family)
MAIKQELVTIALDLSADDRAELARQLILSLEPLEIDADADAAWEAEIESRLQAIDRGEVTSVDWRHAVERARNSLSKPTSP